MTEASEMAVLFRPALSRTGVLAGHGTVSLLLLCCAVGMGQPVPTEGALVVRGVVVELGTGNPIGGAEVTARRRDIADGVMLSGKASGRTVSSATGTFVLELDGPGRWGFSAQHPEYGAPGPELDAYGTSTDLELKGGSKHPPIRIVLARQGSFAGDIRDAATKRPLPGFSVVAGARSRHVQLDAEIPLGRAASGKDGSFATQPLAPAPYRIRVDPPDDSMPTVLPDTVDLESVAEGSAYCTTWWPGVEERNQGGIVSLGSGESRDLGSVFIRKCKTFAVNVRVRAEGCENSGVMRVVLNSDGRLLGDKTLACGRSFHVRQLAAGDYDLTVVAEFKDGRKHTGLARFTVVGRHMTAEVELKPGKTVCGSVRSSSESKLAEERLERLKVNLTPRVAYFRKSGDPGARVAKSGDSCVDDVPAGRLRVFVAGLPDGWAIDRVLDNGQPAGGLELTAWPSGPMVVQITDRAAELAGVVKTSSGGVPDARVFLAPDSGDLFRMRDRIRFTWTDGEGAFRFGKVAAGKYRIFASLPESGGNWTVATALMQLQAGTAVTLEPDEHKQVLVESMVR